MGDFNVTIPKLGESIQEGTITKLLVKEGEFVKEDDILFELATDKVDSEIPSPVAGKIKEIKCTENETYPVGEVVIIISMDGGEKNEKEDSKEAVGQKKNEIPGEESQFKQDKTISEKTSSNPLLEEEVPTSEVPGKKEEIQEDQSKITSSGKGSQERSSEKEISQERFISPLVKNIAEKEGISQNELNSIQGSGLGGRIQRNDVLKFIEDKKTKSKEKVAPESKPLEKTFGTTEKKFEISVNAGPDDTVIKMERIRKLIADHMIFSKNVSAHVTSVVETDVTNLVLWRNKIKDLFFERYNEKITFLPMITEAVAKALNEFKVVNSSVDGDNIILKKHINIGIAVAKEDDTLIVPVIRDADTKNLLGLTKEINGFGKAAKNNKILPDQLQDGTFSITNFGSFKNIIGTPIINQPQVAILAVGLIEKKPAVLETPTGDAIVIRHKMFLSLSYDHRVIDGMLGGKFLRRVADILEQFDLKREI
jgi:2-oxoglutarate dehydrogenase E2 component (dihydrolipoamide succinyltransferase)